MSGTVLAFQYRKKILLDQENLFTLVNIYKKELLKEFLAIRWLSKNSYLNWISQHYFLSKNNSSLANEACEKFIRANKQAGLQYWTEYLESRKGQDQLLLSDSKSMGTSISELDIYPETEALAAAVIGGMQTKSEAYLLGHTLLMEGVLRDFITEKAEELIKVYGENSCKFLIARSEKTAAQEAKQEYTSDLCQDSIQYALSSIRVTYGLYSTLLREIKKNSELIEN